MYRKHSGLSTETIADLVGLRFQDSVNRHERFVRIPDLKTAFAYEAVLRVNVHDIFSGLRDEAIAEVQARALKAIRHRRPSGSGAQRRRRLHALERIAGIRES